MWAGGLSRKESEADLESVSGRLGPGVDLGYIWGANSLGDPRGAGANKWSRNSERRSPRIGHETASQSSNLGEHRSRRHHLMPRSRIEASNDAGVSDACPSPGQVPAELCATPPSDFGPGRPFIELPRSCPPRPPNAPKVDPGSIWVCLSWVDLESISGKSRASPTMRVGVCPAPASRSQSG